MSEHQRVAQQLAGALDELWNDRNVGRLYELALSNIRLALAGGQEQYGRDELMTILVSWLAPYPDLTMEVEAMIAGPAAAGGTLVSLRQQLRGTNLRASRYGPATGRTIDVTRLVSGRLVGGRLVEWWIAEDEGSLLEQLGLDEAAALVVSGYEWPVVGGSRFARGPRPIGQGAPPAEPELPEGAAPPERLVRRLTHDLWNRRLLGQSDMAIAPTLGGRWASGRPLSGIASLQSEILALLAALPDLSHQIDQLVTEGDADGSSRVATHFTILATHGGSGDYGPATGRRVVLTGIAHYELQNGRVDRLWLEYNEARLRASLRAGGPAGPPPDSLWQG